MPVEDRQRVLEVLPATCSGKYSITQQTVLELLNCFLRDDRGGGFGQTTITPNR